MGQQLDDLVIRWVRVLKVSLLLFRYSHLEITPPPTRASLVSSVSQMGSNVIHLITWTEDTRLWGLAIQFKVVLDLQCSCVSLPHAEMAAVCHHCLLAAEQLCTNEGTY